MKPALYRVKLHLLVQEAARITLLSLVEIFVWMELCVKYATKIKESTDPFVK